MTRPIGEDDLQALIDGRLAPEQRAAVDAYLAENPAEAERVAAMRTDLEELRRRLQARHDEPVPAQLRVSALLEDRSRRRRAWLARAAMILVLVCTSFAAGYASRGMNGPGAGRRLMADAVSAHLVYVVEKRHPVEVEAAQEAHLVQWLSNRVGKPLRLPQLAPLGYRLVGGRLLPGGGRAAAQFMYETAEGKRLTVYVRGGDPEEVPNFRFVEDRGVAAFYWSETGFGYAVLGQADRSTLLSAAEAVQDAITAP